MRFPAMRGNPHYRIEVPQLNGGLNLSDPPQAVQDNQLTDAVNVWWHRGALRTRPGLEQKAAGELPAGAMGRTAHFYAANAVTEREQVIGAVRTQPAAPEKCSFYGYSLGLDNGLQLLGEKHDVPTVNEEAPSCMGVKAAKNAGTGYYFFLGGGTILQEGENGQLAEVQPYIPTVLVNGKGVEKMAKEADGGLNGVLYEGYNLLTGAFKCTFSTDGESQYFQLPQKELDSEYTDKKVYRIELQLKSSTGTVSTVTYEATTKSAGGLMLSDQLPVTPAEIGLTESGYTDAYVQMMVLHGVGQIQVVAGATKDGKQEIFAVPYVRSNNLTVTAWKTNAGDREKICRMTQNTWFGGDRSGVAGGTRLFVCGNPEHPNLMHWSDVNNPLYFPENNYAYIGGGDQAVTAFGKQGDLLVIYKEHEIYSAQYVAGQSYTKEDVISGRVTDVAAAAATFPITPLHSSIGCDCPMSVRLVNNKLVWAMSDAHIYMMPSVNQWSERNVRDITAMIRRRLEEQPAEQLKAAQAGEYNGYYTLLVGNTLYLLDAGNSAFQSYAYYSSEKKATRLLPWYTWTLPAPTEHTWAGMVSDGENIRLLAQEVQSGGPTGWIVCTLHGNTDNGAKIHSHFATKVWSFGRPERRKAVKELYFGLGNTEGTRVRVDYVTERGTYEDIYRAECTGGAAEYDAGYMVLRRLTPNINLAQCFGLRFESDGAMAIDGVVLNYQIQGVMR